MEGSAANRALGFECWRIKNSSNHLPCFSTWKRYGVHSQRSGTGGGTLLSSTLGHMAATGDERIKSATFFASQSDFELAGDLRVFTDDPGRAYIESVVEENGGVMPGSMTM